MGWLEGKTIESVRRMSREECRREFGRPCPDHQRPPVLELSDGSEIYPAADMEGNGPGALHGRRSDGQPIAVTLKRGDGGEDGDGGP